MFNARCETLTSKGTFSRLLKHPRQRCIVCAEGFYEWKAEHKVKQPYYVFRQDRPLLFAALHDNWKDGEGPGEDIPTVTILTTYSSERLKWLHERMPVILRDGDACRRWLSASVQELSALWKPYNEEDLQWHPVTTAVNRMGYKGEDCSNPLNVATVSSFFQQKPKGQRTGDASANKGSNGSVGRVKDENLRVEAVNDDAVKHEAVKEEAVKDGTLKDEIIKDKAIKEEGVQEKGVNEKGVKEEVAGLLEADGAESLDQKHERGKEAGDDDRGDSDSQSPVKTEHMASSQPSKKTPVKSRASDNRSPGGNKRPKAAPNSGSKSLLSFYSKAT
jgi:hypothetical protein